MAGRYVGAAGIGRRGKGFQSSPGLMAGRYLRESGEPANGYVLFQSSPGLMAGRYAAPVTQMRSPSMFQSSPGLMAGRYLEQGGTMTNLTGFNPRPA